MKGWGSFLNGGKRIRAEDPSVVENEGVENGGEIITVEGGTFDNGSGVLNNTETGTFNGTMLNIDGKIVNEGKLIGTIANLGYKDATHGFGEIKQNGKTPLKSLTGGSPSNHYWSILGNKTYSGPGGGDETQWTLITALHKQNPGLVISSVGQFWWTAFSSYSTDSNTNHPPHPPHPPGL